MKKQKIIIKNRQLRSILKKGGRIGARRDFFELLKRATASNPLKSNN